MPRVSIFIDWYL